MLARKAAEAGIAGLEFYRGVPGAIGGACVMNAGCYGSETKDVLVEARALTRAGERGHASPTPRWASPTASRLRPLRAD